MKKRLIRIIIGAILFATAIFLPESPAYLGLIGFLAAYTVVESCERHLEGTDAG